MAQKSGSKSKRKYRAERRLVVEAEVAKPRSERVQKRLTKALAGVAPRAPPKNLFLHQGDPTAVVPQRTPPKALDLRSQNNPYVSAAMAARAKRSTTAAKPLQRTA